MHRVCAHRFPEPRHTSDTNASSNAAGESATARAHNPVNAVIGIGSATGTILDDEAATPITSGTYAQLGYQGITGLAYVLLGEDGESKQPLHSSDDEIAAIRMKPSLMDFFYPAKMLRKALN